LSNFSLWRSSSVHWASSSVIRFSVFTGKISEKLTGTKYQQVTEATKGIDPAKIRNLIASSNLSTLKRDFYAIVDVVIWGNIDTRYGSSNLGNFESCRAVGTVKAISVENGAVMATKTVDEKGFGQTKEAAGLDALDNAADIIAEDLFKKLK